ncbi:hypothetical protein DE146DRAFT_421002 [Phaeosphaeria sp. MPI-PUGE-AT-0046c]|nr:hypothetical protein DE146DRAFT_421002 [Phaeosphaeria sp. MPI-PUGE-AT-0046c]
MDTTTETTSQGRRVRSSQTSAPAAPPTYGYHNTYHTHAQLPLGSPPPYARAIDPNTLRHLEEKAQTEAQVALSTALPPPYTCTVQMSGVMGLKLELLSPFQASGSRDWCEVFAVLQGTQLSLYRVKNASIWSKKSEPTAGKLINSYTLQHAEVGVASDFKKTALIPKSPFAHLVPASTRAKLYETDPHLFEPVREHVIRLRLETEQLLLCAPNQICMLDWVESLCAAIDISMDISDRSEPRYRSLPRRSRRQRLLDSAQLGDNLENLSSLEAGRRIIAQQEQIIRQLYPHLAGAREPGFGTTTTVSSGNTSNNSNTDPEIDDFDPEDVRFPTSRSARNSLANASSDNDDEDSSRPGSSSDTDRKNAERIRPTDAQTLRYRRRCAPVLLASSPRVSDVVFSAGTRMRIDVRKHVLVEYTSHPPRYDAHNFPKTKRPSKLKPASKIEPVAIARPGSPIRGVSDDSITSISFGEDLAPSASHGADDITSSGPPSPGLAQTKVEMNKRTSETGLSAVALGVGLII